MPSFNIMVSYTGEFVFETTVTPGDFDFVMRLFETRFPKSEQFEIDVFEVKQHFKTPSDVAEIRAGTVKVDTRTWYEQKLDAEAASDDIPPPSGRIDKDAQREFDEKAIEQANAELLNAWRNPDHRAAIEVPADYPYGLRFIDWLHRRGHNAWIGETGHAFVDGIATFASNRAYQIYCGLLDDFGQADDS